jgi:hypothetical protein
LYPIRGGTSDFASFILAVNLNSGIHSPGTLLVHHYYIDFTEAHWVKAGAALIATLPSTL